MSSPRYLIVAALTCGLLPSAFAQNADHSWQKSYTVSGNPTLTLDASDSNLDVHSCGECRTVHIQVDSPRKLSDYRIEESQSGNRISFSFKEKLHIGVHIAWGRTGSPRITVETPAALTLDASTADGNLTLRDLRGDLQVRTGDGNADLSNLDGNLRIHSGDGNVQIRNASGSLEARASDGHMMVDGRFTSVQIHTSDGNLNFTLRDGSHLNAASRVETSDGAIHMRIPSTLAANLDVTTSDGRIDCSLPLMMDHYDSRNGGGHHVQGRLNAGGVPLSVHTSDGNVSIDHL